MDVEVTHQGVVELDLDVEVRDALQPLKGSNLKRDKLPAAPNGGPILMFVHGTFVDTASTFGKLWAVHPQRVGELFSAYGGRVYALDHPTLGASPVDNALTLVDALPPGATFQIVWPDGSIRWLSPRGRVYFGGEAGHRQPVRMIGIERDITERKMPEEALRHGFVNLGGDVRAFGPQASAEDMLADMSAEARAAGCRIGVMISCFLPKATMPTPGSGGPRSRSAPIAS